MTCRGSQHRQQVTGHLTLLHLATGTGVRMKDSTNSCYSTNLACHTQDLSCPLEEPHHCGTCYRSKMPLILGHCGVDQHQVQRDQRQLETFFFFNDST